MKTSKFYVWEQEFTPSDLKRLVVVWEGDEIRLAMEACCSQIMRVEDAGARLLQIVERESSGLLVVRGIAYMDLREIGEGCGEGAYLPKLGDLEKIQLLQNALYWYDRWASLVDVGDFGGGGVNNWVEWLQKIYLPKLGIGVGSK